MNPKIPTETALRRKAALRGYKLSKIRQTSRWYNGYSPYMISDAIKNVVLHYGVTVEALNEWLNRH